MRFCARPNFLELAPEKRFGVKAFPQNRDFPLRRCCRYSSPRLEALSEATVHTPSWSASSRLNASLVGLKSFATSPADQGRKLTVFYHNPTVYAQRLTDPACALDVKQKIVSELREAIEILQGPDYPRYLSSMVPTFITILNEMKPVFISNSLEQKFRNTIMEIINRFPQNDALRPYSPELMQTLMYLLKVDNEENGVICVKIIIELHKSYKAALEDQVQEFFNIVQDMYRNMDQAVTEVFDEPAVATPGLSQPVSPAPGEAEALAARVLPKSMFSFKVLTECPIILALLFQVHKKYVQTSVPSFVPLIMNVLSLQPEGQRLTHEEAAANGTGPFCGISPNIKNKSAYTEFKALQVKTISFIAYILRSFISILREHQIAIAASVVGLLQDCPPDASATRKELLVAARHLWSTDFREPYIQYIDILLNEEVLVGSGVTCRENLRPLAHNVLVDLIHHIRAQLSPAQLARTIKVYSRNLQDPTFGLNIQTMCARLLLNLIESIVAIPDKAQARMLLIRILEAFTLKFSALSLSLPVIVKFIQRKKAQTGRIISEDFAAIPELDGYMDLGYAQPIRTSLKSLDVSQDIVKEVRLLFKTLVSGVKSILGQLRLVNPPPPPGMEPEVWNNFPRNFNEDEVETLIRLTRDGVKCFDIYFIDNLGPDGLPLRPSERTASPQTVGSKEEKEVLEIFASIFTYVDPAVFQEIFATEIGYLFDQILVNMSILAVPQYFLANASVSSNFAGLLLRFLVDRLPKLGGPDSNYSAVMLRLFKLLFMAVTLFPDKNESVLKPHLSNLIMNSMKLSAKAKEPLNYFLLLRALFRSIGGGRFELLYQEVLPLLQVLLEGLNGLLSTAYKPQMKELFVELCLTVPVRLSVLLPYLSFLMKPLVQALQAGPELVSQGLRTLELCIDNLTQEFLEPIMSPVIDDLMTALWKHLRPPPYNSTHSLSTMRILGKLGGRNRRLLKDPLLIHKLITDNGLDMNILFHGTVKSEIMPFDICLNLVNRVLVTPAVPIFYKQQALAFAKGCLPLLFDVSIEPEEFDAALQIQIKNYLEERVEVVMRQREQQQFGMNIVQGTPLGFFSKLDKHMNKILYMVAVYLPGAGLRDLSYTSKSLRKTLIEHPDLRNRTEMGKAHHTTEDLGDPFGDLSNQPTSNKRTVHAQASKEVFAALFSACLVTDLADEAWKIVEDCCRHFALLAVTETIQSVSAESPKLNAHMHSPPLRVDALIDAVIDVVSAEDVVRRQFGVKVLTCIFNMCVTLTGSKEAVETLPIFHIFASRFCSCCYQVEWFKKSGGCLGITLLSSQLDLSTQWVLDHELDFVRALVFVLKDTSPEMAPNNVEDATQTLSHVLKVCNVPPLGSDAQAKLHSLTAVLMEQLCNANSAVREAIQSAFQLIHHMTGTPISELLHDVKERLLVPIFSKPLRALPFSMQIGNIDAITYCLGLRPPFLPFGDELLRLLHEGLALADAEDQALVGKGPQIRNAASLVSLRVVCIKLLTTAMACEEFSNQARNANTKGRIIAMFFKSLYSKSPEIVEVANRGLQQVLTAQSKLPKDLLQAGLRPILVNLSDHKRLTVTGLEGLARLLELLTNYFKVEIGKKLLDHLRLWADKTLLEDAAGKPLSEIEEARIIVAILDVFYLLPQAANIFLDELVKTIIELESALRRSFSSPFRNPLIKFLNRYSAESVDYFYERMLNPTYLNLFVALLRSEYAVPLRAEIMKDSGKFLNITLLTTDEANKEEMIFGGVLIAREISRHHPEWLLLPNGVVKALVELYRKKMANPLIDDSIGSARSKEPLYLAEILIVFCKRASQEVDVVLELVHGFLYPGYVDYGFLKQFFYDEVVMSYTGRQKRAVLDRFFVVLSDANVTREIKATMLRMVIIPMMLVSMQKDEEIVDHHVVEEIHRLVWLEGNSGPDDMLEVELLQLTTLLIQFVPNMMEGSRKDMSKWAWKHIYSEEVTCKNAPYVLLARFLSKFEAPVKLVRQIYVYLLRSHASEARILARQALDILIDVIGQRLPDDESKTGVKLQVPTWVRYIRRAIVDDQHSVPHLLVVYQLLIRHHELFYDAKDLFMVQIAASLHRLGLSANATPESRALTVELSELVLKWETRQLDQKKISRTPTALSNLSESKPLKRTASENELPGGVSKRLKDDEANPVLSINDADGDPSTGDHLVDPQANSSAANVHKETHINYLIRMISTWNEPPRPRGVPQRVLEIVRGLLQVWPDCPFKLSFFEKAMDIAEQNINAVCNSIDLMGVLCDCRPHDWIISNITQLQKYVEVWIRSDNQRIVKSLHSVLVRIFDAIASAETHGNQITADIRVFVNLVDTVIADGLKEPSNKHVLVSLLVAAYTHKPEALDPMLPGLIELLTKLVKDHTAGGLLSQQQPHQQQVAVPPPLAESPAALINILLPLLKTRVGVMTDPRRGFLFALIALLEKSSDAEVLRTILNMVREWVMKKSTQSFPTMKENAALLVKMMNFELRQDKKLLEEYLTLVADIYTDKHFARSELTARLEQAFLLGTKVENPLLRQRFSDIFNTSVTIALPARMLYVLGVQNWEPLSLSFWLRQALDLLMGSIVTSQLIHASAAAYRTPSVVSMDGNHMMDVDVKVPETVSTMLSSHRSFLKQLQSLQVGSLLEPLRYMIHMDPNVTYGIWVTLFPLCWNALNPQERHDVVKAIVALLSKDYHAKQMESRPNVVQALLEGVCRCAPPMRLPPQLVKYIGKSYNAWHIGIELLQSSVLEIRLKNEPGSKDDDRLHESTYDALTDMFTSLSEDDLFFGLWRRRCLYSETNAALSYEQTGMWATAQKFYEQAQARARQGLMPFTEAEYNLWEERWVSCAERLQQWNILVDLAKHEQMPDLMLEAAWRFSDWSAERQQLAQYLPALVDQPTPRRKIFEAFLALTRLSDGQERAQELSKACDEGAQLALRKWYSLPEHVSTAHVPLLHTFQQLVELHEALGIHTNLSQTMASNLETKSQELKGILQTWRERLPNLWDGIDIWSDINAWRQHVFSTINEAYKPLIPLLSQSGANSQSSYAFRGYHETAWIINRFAHVARKYGLVDVCNNALSKIYTLPNIEIQEAFYKLREQAKCHLQSIVEYSTGLEVINNTNLMYFSTQQKAEFFTLKGVFLGKLNLHEEAASVFASAVQIDLSHPKAWAAWGQYSDRMFKEQPREIKFGRHAINCYLQAAGIYNNARSRKYLARILWLLSVDDAVGNIYQAYETYKGDVPLWYWITFVPQLLLQLASREPRPARMILIKLARTFPQALHFHLRTTKEDYIILRRQAQAQPPQKPPEAAPQPPPPSAEGTAAPSPATEGGETQPTDPNISSSATPQPVQVKKNPWEYIEELMALLKTAFPLLALTMETLVEQIVQRLKPSADEDIYRLIVALLGDGVTQLARDPGDSGALSQATEVNLRRFADSMYPNHLKYKGAFERDFIHCKPTLPHLVDNFRTWRDRLEAVLDSRPKKQNLEHFSVHLVEFEYQKYDDIEIPGQYLQMKDNNKDFVRIERFQPVIDIVRGHFSCHRRITIKGTDGLLYPFAVQHPAPRTCRREERIMQLFRILNSVLERKQDTRRRGLYFHLPLYVPLAPQVRLFQDDTSYMSLQDIYEEHCARTSQHKDEPIMYYINRMREIHHSEDMSKQGKVAFVNLKTEVMEDIAAKFVPDTILTNYMTRALESYSDFFSMRKHFCGQMATVTFMTYLLSINQRVPQKFFISVRTGNIWSSELVPTLAPPPTVVLTNSEAVPFRFTPNIQHFMTPIGIDGAFTSSLISLAKSLTEPEFELDDYLSVFVRDEIIQYLQMGRKPPFNEQQLREVISTNVEIIMKRANALCCRIEREKGATSTVPATQTVLDLCSTAANPNRLAQMDLSWMSQL
ncbi:hypothetical protein SeMB42_g00090 [Synchytrium endobioticum]|uniref:Non-specific serine/threonine protein kinase n=1 Tax=Synchytrium endobioticum TaxID=286115 RepID=A0A507DUI8_9FUNG|nr:hypothetical protein SeLEV6574_g00180 [Synchytrium endobioticum]TPX54895.1 hypothetical protein SeMB42_g00090 [Synchytrium endobioticum]